MKHRRSVMILGVLSALILPTFKGSAGCTPPPGGLVGWWRAENNCQDAQGGLAGQPYGSVTFPAGAVGLCFDLGGFGAHVRVPDQSSLHFTNAMTAEAWVYPRSQGDYQIVLSKWDVGLNGNHSYCLGLFPDGRGYLVLCADGNSQVTGFAAMTNALPLNEWTHLVATYDGQLIKIYVNGAYQAEAAYSQGIFPGTHDLGIGATVGAAAPGDSAYALNGRIDEASLYNRALTAGEVAALYAAGSAGKCLGDSAPYITEQPHSQSVLVGSNVTFSVSATGTTPLAYQWRFNGADLEGATDSSYTLANVQPERAGTYAVQVTNALGSVVSADAVLTVRPLPACTKAPAYLVSWWPGQGNAADVVGVNSGTLYGGVTFPEGMVGTAFGLDGAKHVRVADNQSLHFSKAMTVEVWVYPTGGAMNANLISKWDLAAGLDQRSYGLGVWPDGRAYFGVSRDGTDGTAATAWSTSTIPVSTWTHLAATYDGKVLSMYVNGKLEGTASYPDEGSIFPGTGDLGIGGCVGGATPGDVGYMFAGRLDEPSLYAAVLTPSEIQAIYTAGAGGKCLLPVPPFIVSQPASHTNLIGESVTLYVSAGGSPPLGFQWTSNATAIEWATNSSLTLSDLKVSDSATYAVVVTNAYGSTLSSNAILTVLAAPPCAPIPSNLVSWWPGEGDALDQAGGNQGSVAGATYMPGRVGQSFALDGVDDVVLLGNPANLRLQNLSIEGWIKRTSPTEVTRSYYGPNRNEGFIFAYGAGGYGLSVDYAGRLGFGRVGGTFIQTGGGLYDTNWHHVAVTRTNTTVALYIDGVRRVAGSYIATFTFTNNAALGARPDTLRNVFYGQVDELSVYSRALAEPEIQAIYTARMAGKCPATFPPLISVQPVEQSVLVGADVTFTVQATGTPPLAYQWKRDGVDLEGKTGASLALTRVQMSEQGRYSVGLTNAFGGTMSSEAVLKVSLPPALVRVLDSEGPPAGGTAIVPVVLVANGNENALGFSLTFDVSKLTFLDAAVGSGVSGAQLLIGDSQLSSGKVGLAIGLPSGTVIAAGTQEVARVRFATAPAIAPVQTQITFGDQPILRQVSDPAAAPLPAVYEGGTLSYPASQFEGDMAPRPDGGTGVSIIDWVQAGRFVARLDYPANGSEFQRADCAPRSTKGDGAITVNDWVQTGRYAAGTDALELAGGATEEGGTSAPLRGAGGEIQVRQDGQVRTVSVTEGTLLNAADSQIAVQLQAEGDESALSFSLSFDKDALVYVGAEKGSGIGEAILNVNTELAGQGKVGFAAAVMNSTFGPGLREVVKLTFRAAATSGAYPVVLGDQPVPRGVSDTNALGLSAEYLNGTVYVNPQPSLKIKPNVSSITLAWPNWATNYVLQEASEPVNSPISWTNVVTKPEVLNGEQVLTFPTSGSTRFYRLQR